MAKKRISARKLLMDYYAAMSDRFGHRNWWPADTPFEVCVGAILTQNTAWRNVVKAIDNLKHASALDPFAILIAHMVEKHLGDLDSLFSPPVASLREELLSIKGVGKETADSIILYAAGKPIFVIDAYTKRVLERHGFIEENTDYDSIQRLFHSHLPLDVALFNDFHAQFVAVGHHYCKKRPLCEMCPLHGLLPVRAGLQAIPKSLTQ
jgi:endonuclease-3 related protein